MKKIIVSIIICIITFGIIFLNISNEEENNKENKNISIVLETEEGNIETNTFPSKEDYVYDKLVCKNMENTVETTFDKDTWKLNLSVEEERIDGDFQCNIYFLEKKEYDFDYTGDPQTFTAPISGAYKIELWGASSYRVDNPDDGISPSDIIIEEVYGSFVSGNIELSKDEKLYLYIGEKGKNGTKKTSTSQTTNTYPTFNGGGQGGTAGNPRTSNGEKHYYIHGSSGAGATDARLVNSDWDNSTSLNSRIMVASGASGTDNGGGLIGYKEHVVNNYESYSGIQATQTDGNQFGIGENGEDAPTIYCNGQAGGGGGYYGGGGAKASGYNCHIHSASSGSSYISGHTGCVAITSEESSTPKNGCTTGTTNNSCSLHYSEKIFTDTIMIDGAGYKWTNTKGSLTLMPNPSGGYYESGKGHTGNGYARITLVE